MTGNTFVYCLMTLNAGASITYFIQGDAWRAGYWACAFAFNLCFLNLK